MQDCRLFQLIFNTGACPTSTAVLTVGHFWCTSSDSLTDSDLQLLIETEQDRKTFTNTIFVWAIFFLAIFKKLGPYGPHLLGKKVTINAFHQLFVKMQKKLSKNCLDLTY